jgi:pectin methylesterase-like acyl-CoA thioesterase
VVGSDEEAFSFILLRLLGGELVGVRITRCRIRARAGRFVLGIEDSVEIITFQNDFNRTHEQVSAGSQAQALNMEGDRNILDRVHILANQDTLYIGARGCGQAGSLRTTHPSSTSFPPSETPVPAAHVPCTPAVTRSYFTHCVVAGNVDFIYGDGNAVFNDCEIHSTLHAAGGYLTAQGKYLAEQQSTVPGHPSR